MAGYIVHKAVSLDKVKAARRKVLAQPGYLEDHYMGQRKYDGCSVVFKLGIAGQGDAALSRTGERVRSLEWLLPSLQCQYAREVVNQGGIVLLAEAWSKTLPFEQISGNFRRHTPWLDPTIKVFDLLPLDDFEAGYCATPYMARMATALVVEGCAYKPSAESEVSIATTHFTPNTAGYRTWQAVCDALVDRGGYDGLILRDPQGTWTRGSGTTGEILKLKRVLSFDLRVIEVMQMLGEKTGRAVYKVAVDFKGKRLVVGSGVPHNRESVPIVGDIVEVEAMDYSSNGLLREPRYKGIRFDKLETD